MFACIQCIPHIFNTIQLCLLQLYVTACCRARGRLTCKYAVPVLGTQ